MMSNDGERFRRSGFLRGYAVSEVDAFCRRVQDELRQRRAGRDLVSGLTPEEVQAVAFSAERGGYREDEVDAFLDQVAAELRDPRTAPKVALPDQPGEQQQPATPAPTEHEFRALLTVTTLPFGERFPRTNRLLKGYHAEQVDQFTERVRGTLNHTLTPDDVGGIQFDTERRGYDMARVDEWLEAVQDYVRRRQPPASPTR